MPSDAADRRLVLVAGSTRSGTSLAAGTLHHLGLHVPQPVLKANTSNPAGFFESSWPVDFHKRLMDRSVVGSVDARPEVFELMMSAIRPQDRAELVDWLRGEFEGADQVVVKDPRASWVTELWRDAVETLDGRLGILLMVRHPAEVVASRSTYYAVDLAADRAWRYRVRNLAAWINLTTGVELRTRGLPRVIARYEDLLADWRRVAARVGEEFGLTLALGTNDGGAHPVDDFVNPSLRRHQPSWSGTELPGPLIEIAESVWSAISELAGDDPSRGTLQTLDTLRAAFATEMRIATALAYDATAAEVVAARRQLELEAAASSSGARSSSVSKPRKLVRRHVPVWMRRLAPRLRQSDVERLARADAVRAAEQPILADLRAAGVTATSLLELVNAPERDPAALPVLLENLEHGGYPDQLMERLGRGLAVPPALEYWDRLKAVYLTAKEGGQEVGAAIALAGCATKAQLDDLIDFLSIAERGDSRIYFLRPIKRLGGQRGRDLLESLHDDPTLGKEASSLLFTGAAAAEAMTSPVEATTPEPGEIAVQVPSGGRTPRGNSS